MRVATYEYLTYQTYQFNKYTSSSNSMNTHRPNYTKYTHSPNEPYSYTYTYKIYYKIYYKTNNIINTNPKRAYPAKQRTKMQDYAYFPEGEETKRLITEWSMNVF